MRRMFLYKLGGHLYFILWEFRVRPAARRRFIRAYGPNGAWARLFHKAPGYLATRLLPDPANHLRFITVDVWHSRQSFVNAQRRLRAEYRALDVACEKLTASERKIGSFSLSSDPRL